ncbi:MULTISPECIES: FxSxx-COOH system tetratricopeptide repeat protein [unclassified Streptomyces]|uniref:FxSxx-COOH system tetratricopeptide repeat protein n=1 Tax=unclassified Streptomyces TaxID=2593676 RepID=UPI002DD94BF6|nr:FxSxx-COOH system tetratricopeptide repeat protein [Streptomyces sp. NBC_00243]WRZ22917.1 FxSxx-COOH system tetratricopeptide repeat protein [Streptomyces sp. NBC_00243]
MTDHREGRIITFYSYKGGVGRTMALANVAWILASNGYRVLASDWDLETPGGLPRYYQPFLPQGALGFTTGLIDQFADFADAARRRGQPDDELYQRHAGVENAMSVDWAFPGSGWLNCLSAGRQDRDYHATLASFRWPDLDARFLNALRERWRREYDYVLIDSRSGMGSAVDICVRELPDVLVSCFTLNDQSIEGAAQTARHVARNAPARGIRILPVPMRVNEQQASAFIAGRTLARARFADLPHGLSAEAAHRYWEENRIPHHTGYEHEEILATFKDAPGDPQSLLSAYERLTSVITAGRVTRLPALDESLRKFHLGSYVRPLSPEATPIVLSSVPRDRIWADWVRWVLTQAGFQVVPSAFSTDGRGSATALTVMLVSSAYLRSSTARADWPSIDNGQDPVLLRIDDDAALTPPFTRYTPVELTTLDTERARAAVLHAVGRRVPDQGGGPGPSFPNDSPAVWQAPPRNPRFVGRDPQLNDVHDALGVSRWVAVRATGRGMGRRQLAVEYVHRFRADYDLVWWVPAVARHLAAASLAGLARRLDLPADDGIEPAARRALATLESGRPYDRWLLVYDDADPEELTGLLPSGTGRVLLTARGTEWEERAHPLALESFSPEESAELLQGRVPGLGGVEAGDLAIALGELPPLALDQVGAWLAETDSPVEEYLAELGLSDDGTQTGSRPTGSAEAPTRLAEAALRKRSPAAHRLLQLCCCFAPLPLSLSAIRTEATLAALRRYDTSLRDQSQLEGLIADLDHFCLAETDHAGHTLRVHRLVERAVLADLSPDERESAHRDLHGILSAAAARPGR